MTTDPISIFKRNVQSTGFPIDKYQKRGFVGEEIYLLDDLAPKESMLPKTPEQIDTHNLVGNYLLSENLAFIPGLTKSIDSTVMINQKYKFWSSGVIVNHNNNQYLITAGHVSDLLISGETNNLEICRFSGNVLVAESSVSKENLLYPTKDKIDNGFPIGDLAIFKYHGKLDGVSVKLEDVGKSPIQAFTIGYPRIFGDRLLEMPLVSFGFAKEEEKKLYENDVISDLLRRLNTSSQTNELKKILFSGVTSEGDSGGPLVNINGDLIGIASCVYGPAVDKTGLRVFYPVKEIIEKLV